MQIYVHWCVGRRWLKTYKDLCTLMCGQEVVENLYRFMYTYVWADKIPCSEIRKRTKIIDIIEYTLKQKWKWAGHIARLKDNRWTKRCTEWQPRRGKRSRGRPSRRWQDDITEKEGTTWIRKATDRRRWKTLVEGYILQWMDKA